MKFLNIIIIATLFIYDLFPNKVFAHGEKEPVYSDSIFEYYNFIELWNPQIILILFVIYFLYLKGIRKVMERKREPVSGFKILSFLSGLIVFYAAIGSPLHLLGDDYLFSAHMLNQSLVYVAFPPLILLGIPEVLVKPFIQKIIKVRVVSLLLKPIFSLFLFNILFSIYHIPYVFDTIVASSIMHNLTHTILTISAFLMWIQIVPVTVELNKILPIYKIGYIFAAGMLLTPACALIIFADELLYTTYANVPELFMSALEDQQVGGIVMKVFQEAVFSPIIGYIFFKWAKEQREHETIDDIKEISTY